MVIPNVGDDDFPSYFAKKSEKALLEDARVLYVGMTRAKSNLWLTFANTKQMHSQKGLWTKNQALSRFLLSMNWNNILELTSGKY